MGSLTDQPDEPAVLLPPTGRTAPLRVFLRAYSRASGAFAVLIGSLVLVGWALGLRDLMTFSPRWPPMMTTTAVASVLCGAALSLLTPSPRSRWPRVMGRLCALATCLLAISTLAGYVGVPNVWPDRPAPQIASAFLLLGGSLLLLDHRTVHGVRPAEVLALLAGAILVIALLGHLFGIEAMYGLPAHHHHTGMAMHSAAVLLALSSGTLAARPDTGLMSIITSEDLGGTAARRLLWSLFVLPPVAVAVVLGARAGWYSTSFAFAFLLFFSLVDGVVVILLTGSRLSRLEGRIKRAQLALASAHEREGLQRARLQALFDAMPESVIITDEHGNIVQQNHAAEKFARDTARVDPWGNALHYDVRLSNGEPVASEELPIYRALAGGETVVGVELAIVPPDGKLVPIMASATPLVTDHGLGGAIVVYQDIRSLKELERLREEWAAIVAHDLRQPLAVISLSAALLQKLHEGDLPAQERKAIERIRSAALRLHRMIDDLLDASRIEAKRLSLGCRMVDLSALIEKVVEDLQETTTGFSIEVTDEPVLIASVDSDRIQQVLENLLGNAAKYGEPGAPIVVDAARKGDMIEVTVTNRGAGIPADQLPNLFNRFARTKEARASRESGLGLGLYISKGLVEAHGGHLWAESVPGETTSFHFTVPVATGPEAERSVDQGQTSAVTHC